MAQKAERQASLGRSAKRELRRQQLIEATIDAIAKRGFSDTKMSDVAAGAGLSQGIVNFHFRTKEELLLETLRAMNEEYRDTWMRALAAAGAHPADRLWAILAADLEPAVCTKKKIAVWHAFYGEAKTRPTYQKICGDRDDERWDIMTDLIDAMIQEGGYADLGAQVLAQMLTAMTDGLWLDFHLGTARIDRPAAERGLALVLASLFPKHFTQMERPAA